MINIKLLVYVYEYQLFIIKHPKAVNFKNDLAKTKSKPWYQFLV